MSRVATLELNFEANLQKARADYAKFRAEVEGNPLGVPMSGAHAGGGVTLGGLPVGAGAIPGSQGNASLQQMIQQQTAALQQIPTAITQAFGQMLAAMQQGGAAGGGGGMGGGGAGGGGAGGAAGGGYKWGAITRQLAAGFLARDALSIYRAGQEQDAALILAGGSQAAQARAQLAYSAKVGGIAFGVFDDIFDGKRHRAQSERIILDAEDQGRADEGRAGGAAFRHRFRAETASEGAGGSYERRGLDLQERAFHRRQDIEAARRAEMDPVNEQARNIRAGYQKTIDDFENEGIILKDYAGRNEAERKLKEFNDQQSKVEGAMNRRWKAVFGDADRRQVFESMGLRADRRFELGAMDDHSEAQGMRSDGNHYDAAARFELKAAFTRQVEHADGGRSVSLGALGVGTMGLGGLPALPGAGLGMSAPDYELMQRQRNAYEADKAIMEREQQRHLTRINMGLSTHAAETQALLQRDPTSARVAGIVGAGQMSALDLFQHGYDAQGRQSIANTVGDLNLQKQQYLDQFRATRIGNFESLDNPRDVENPTQVLQNIEKGIQSMKEDIIRKMDELVSN